MISRLRKINIKPPLIGNQQQIYTSPQELRLAIREGKYCSQTSGQAPGYAQANIVILPKSYAFDFLLFCQRNPKPCPLLHVLEPGEYLVEGKRDMDIRTDIPKYKVFENGNFTKEVDNISSIWREDLVTFVIGCSFSFEEALQRAKISIRHIDMNKNVPMYNTNIPCKSAGLFNGNLVVSMRPMLPIDAIKATEITGRYPKVHGAPIHIGDPVSLT
jgi:uncharacterized protein YcsI (UPF0317 family)